MAEHAKKSGDGSSENEVADAHAKPAAPKHVSSSDLFDALDEPAQSDKTEAHEADHGWEFHVLVPKNVEVDENALKKKLNDAALAYEYEFNIDLKVGRSASPAENPRTLLLFAGAPEAHVQDASKGQFKAGATHVYSPSGHFSPTLKSVHSALGGDGLEKFICADALPTHYWPENAKDKAWKQKRVLETGQVKLFSAWLRALVEFTGAEVVVLCHGLAHLIGLNVYHDQAPAEVQKKIKKLPDLHRTFDTLESGQWVSFKTDLLTSLKSVSSNPKVFLANHPGAMGAGGEALAKRLTEILDHVRAGEGKVLKL